MSLWATLFRLIFIQFLLNFLLEKLELKYIFITFGNTNKLENNQ